MRILDYLKQQKMTQADFARIIDELPQAVERYVNNKRIPRPDIIQKIFTATKGAVTPNDFYTLPQPEKINHSNNSGELE